MNVQITRHKTVVSTRANTRSTVVRGILIVGFVTLTLACTTVAGARSSAHLPEWYLDPPHADDVLYGVGAAQMSRPDVSIRMARNQAREDIAFQMNAQIQSVIVDYFQETGIGTETQQIQFMEAISRQVTEATLEYVTYVTTDVRRNGTVYALVSVPVQTFRTHSSHAFQRSAGTALAEFNAVRALEMLDTQLTDNPTAAGTQN